MTGGGQGFSPRRELVLMARAMTRWLRANGFPGESVRFEVGYSSPNGCRNRFYARTPYRARFVRVRPGGDRKWFAYTRVCESRAEAVALFRDGVEKVFGASAAELSLRLEAMGRDAAARLMDPSEVPVQGLV